MKLLALEIVGFGHFRDYHVPLNEQFTLLFGENEKGKTTIYYFIRTILFGFPPKRKNSRDYTPKDGGKYGGHLIFIHPVYGRVRVTRFKGVQRHQATVTSLDDPDQTIELEELLGPLTEDIFKDVFTLEQQQLSDIKQVAEENLQELLLTIGLAGSQGLFNKQSLWHEEQQKLYKVRGNKPELNHKLIDYREVSQKISEKKSQESLYRQVQENLVASEAYQVELKATLVSLAEQIKQTEAQLTHFPLLEDYRHLKKQLNQEKISRLSQADYDQLMEGYYQLEQLKKQENDYLKRQENTIQKLGISPALTFYLREEQDLIKLTEEEVLLANLVKDQQFYLEELSRVRRQLSEGQADLLRTSGETREPVPLPAEIVDQLQQLSLAAQANNEQLADAQKQVTEQQAIELKRSQDQQQLLVRKKQWFMLPLVLFIVALGLFFINVNWAMPLLIGSLVVAALVGWLLVKTDPLAAMSEQASTDLVASQNRLRELETAADNIAITKQRMADTYHFNHKNEWSEWLYQLPLRKHLLELKDKESQLSEYIDVLSSQLQVFEDAFDHYRQWIPAGGSLPEKMAMLVRLTKEAQAERQELFKEEAVTDWQAPLEQIQTSQRQLVQELEEQYPLLKATSLAAFMTAQKNLQGMQKELVALESRLTPYFDLATSDGLHAESLNQSYQGNLELYQQTKHDEDQLAEKIRDDLFLIQQIEKDGTLAELYQEEAVLVDELMALAKEWGSLAIASTVVDDVLGSLSTQRLPALLRTTGLFLNRLTLGNYQQCDMKDNQLMISNHDGVCYYLNELSTGTRDQLYLAIRLAFIELHQGADISPLIIDDAWLHYDSRRKEALFNVLKELSQTIQVICLSSDQEIVSFSEKNQVDMAHL